MSGDINQRITAERAKAAQFERDYERAYADCIFHLESLRSELGAIQRRVPEAMAELELPRLVEGRTNRDKYHDVSDWYYWDRHGEYGGVESPALLACFYVIRYNPIANQWKFSHSVSSRNEVVEAFTKALTEWVIYSYPNIVRQRQDEASRQIAERERREEKLRSKRHDDLMAALGWLFLLFVIISGIISIINE